MKYNMVKRMLLLVVLAVNFSYCKKPTEFKEIEVNGLFTLQIPTFLHPTTDLMPFTASNFHQYEDSVGKVCLLIFDTSRTEIDIPDLKTFYDSMVSRTLLDSAQMTPGKLVKVDGDSAYRSEIAGIQHGVWIFSEIETIATKDRYYHIVTWSSFNRRDKLRDDMIKMLNSFHDINHVKK